MNNKYKKIEDEKSILDAQEDPLVSIILPCYNSGKYLQQTIDSVLAQTYKNWELIAIDDCSTDNTLEILQAAAALDTRIKVITHAINAGRPSMTKNTGLRHAEGDYIQFIDHDDIYLPDKTRLLLDVLIHRPACCAAFSNMYFIDRNGNLDGIYLKSFISDGHQLLTPDGADTFITGDKLAFFMACEYTPISTQTCLIAKHRINHLSIEFNETFTICEDKELWIRIAINGKFVYLDQPLALYRLHETNLTKDDFIKAYDIAKLLRKSTEILKPRLCSSDLKKLNAREAETYATLGWYYRVKNQRRNAFSAFFHAFVTSPSFSLAIALAKFWLPARQ